MKVIKNNELFLAAESVHLEIRETGWAYLDSRWNYRNVCYGFSQIYIPISGEAQLHCDHCVHELRPGNIYILPAGLHFNCHCDGNMEKYFIDFSLTRAGGIDLLHRIDHCIVLKDTWNILKTMQEMETVHKLHAAIQLKMLLFQILDRIASRETSAYFQLNPYSDCTDAALSYIQQNLSAQISIQQIADALYVSRYALQKYFREDIGKPIGKYIDERIMAAAERYLLAHSMSIRDISETLGYCDQFYFCRKFTQYHGMNPSQFRKNHNFML